MLPCGLFHSLQLYPAGGKVRIFLACYDLGGQRLEAGTDDIDFVDHGPGQKRNTGLPGADLLYKSDELQFQQRFPDCGLADTELPSEAKFSHRLTRFELAALDGLANSLNGGVLQGHTPDRVEARF